MFITFPKSPTEKDLNFLLNAADTVEIIILSCMLNINSSVSHLLNVIRCLQMLLAHFSIVSPLCWRHSSLPAWLTPAPLGWHYPVSSSGTRMGQDPWHMSGSLRLCLCPVTGREWCMPAYSSSAAWITHTLLTTVSVIQHPPLPVFLVLFILVFLILSVTLKTFKKTGQMKTREEVRETRLSFCERASFNTVSLCFQCKKDFKFTWNICRKW